MATPRLLLGEQVLDKGLISKDGRRVGKVDDLLLEINEEDPESLPEVLGILTGPLTLAEEWQGWLRWLMYRLYRFLGIANPKPIFIPWDAVVLIQAVVRLDLTRRQVGLTKLIEAVDRRFVRWLPWT